VFIECTACYRADGPPELRTLGETEFVNGVAAMSASGGYGPTLVAAGIVGLVDLTIGARAEEVLHAHMAAAGPRFKGRRTAGRTRLRDAQQPHQSAASPLSHHAKFREGFAALALGLTFGTWLYHPQLPDLTALARAFQHSRSSSTTWAAAGARLVRGQPRRDLRRLEARHSGARGLPQRLHEARRPRHAHQRIQVPPPRASALI
jgi:hypothetical protein